MLVNKLLKNVKKLNGNFFRNTTAENVLAFKQLKAKARYLIKTQKENLLAKFLLFANIKNQT